MSLSALIWVADVHTIYLIFHKITVGFIRYMHVSLNFGLLNAFRIFIILYFFYSFLNDIFMKYVLYTIQGVPANMPDFNVL